MCASTKGISLCEMGRVIRIELRFFPPVVGRVCWTRCKRFDDSMPAIWRPGLEESICRMRSRENIRTRTEKPTGNGCFRRFAWPKILEAVNAAGTTLEKTILPTFLRWRRHSYRAGGAGARRRPNDDDLPARDEQAWAGGEESGGWVVGHGFLVEAQVLG